MENTEKEKTIKYDDPAILRTLTDEQFNRFFDLKYNFEPHEIIAEIKRRALINRSKIMKHKNL